MSQNDLHRLYVLDESQLVGVICAYDITHLMSVGADALEEPDFI